LSLLPQKELFRWVCFFFPWQPHQHSHHCMPVLLPHDSWFMFQFSLAFVFSS
jgi:hypothetical protein